MGWLRSLFRPPPVVGIATETLDFVLAAAADTHPNEYMGMLRGVPAGSLDVDRDGVVITDVLVIPGTRSNSVSATVKTRMIPTDVRTAGSVHSHPSGALRPSDADLKTFGRGQVHIIVGAPYGRRDWRAFDSTGSPRDLDVLDVDIPDPESFFDFDQADIDAELKREGRPRW